MGAAVSSGGPTGNALFIVTNNANGVNAWASGNYVMNFGGTAGTVTNGGSYQMWGINILTNGYVFTIDGTSNNARTLTMTNSLDLGTNSLTFANGARGTNSYILAGPATTGWTGGIAATAGSAGIVIANTNPSNLTNFGFYINSGGTISSNAPINILTLSNTRVMLGSQNSGGGNFNSTITNNSAGGSPLELTNSSSGTVAFNGVISGSNGLAINSSSSGKIALNASNTFSGGSTVNGTGTGQLNLGNSSALGTGALTIAGAGTTNYVRASANNLTFSNAVVINSGSTLQLAATNTGWRSTWSGTISGPGSILYAYSDIGLYLTGTNSSFGGGVTLGSSGTLFVASLGLAGANSSVGTNGTLTISFGGNTSAGVLQWLGTSSETSDKTFLLAATSTNSSTGLKIFAGDTSQGGTNLTLTLNGNINSTGTNNKVITLGAYNSNTLVVNGLINQTVGYTNSVVVGVTGQSGTVVLGNTNNSFGGGVSINAGSSSTNVVQVAFIGNAGANSALGTNGTINIGGGSSSGINVLKYTGSGETNAKVINLAGTTGGATLDQSGTGNLKFTTAMTATGAGAKTLVLQGSTAGTGEVATDLGDLGGNVISLSKSGSGTWTLSGNNSYSGTTTVSGGTLVMSGSNSSSGTTALSGGTLAVTGTNSGNGNITLSAGGTLDVGGKFIGTNAVTVSGAGAVLKVAQTNGMTNATLLGASGSANIATVNLAGGGDYTMAGYGSDASAGGTMAFTNSSGLATTLTFTNATNAITLSSSTSAGRQLTNYSADLTITFGGSTLDIGSSATNDITFGGAGNFVINSSVVNTSSAVNTNGTGVRGLLKDGTGTMSLAGANSYNGATTVSNGVLRISHSSALGTTNSGTSVLNGGALELTNNISVDGGESLSLAGSGPSSSGALRNIGGDNTYGGALTLSANTRIGSDAGTLRLTNGNAIAGDYSLTFGGAGNIVLSSAYSSPSWGVTKEGTGTMTLSGGNGYGGVTTVSAGTLVASNNSALGIASTASVAANATLQIAANVAKDTITNSGTISIGAGSGLTASSLGSSSTGALSLAGTAGNQATFTSAAAAGLSNASTQLAVGSLTLGGYGTIALANPYNTISASGAINIAGAGNLLSIAGSWDVGQTYLLLSSSTSLAAANISLTNSTWGGSAALGGYYTSGRTTYFFDTNATSLFMSLSGGAANLTWKPSLASGDWNYETNNQPWTNNADGLDSSFYSGDNVTLGTEATISVTNSGVTAGAVTSSASSGSVVLTGGTLTAASLTQSGSGTLLLSNNTTISSETVSAGTLSISGGVTNSVSAFVLSGGTVSGTGVLTNSGLYDLQSGTVGISLNGSSGLTKSTGGTVNLLVTNGYGGTTTISGGTLAYGIDNALPASGNLLLTGGTLDLSTYNGAVGTVTASGGNITGTGVLTGTSYTLANSGGSATIAAVLAGSTGLAKSGAGTYVLANTNVYTGTTTISGGMLRYGISDAIFTNDVIVNGGTLDIASYSDSVGTVRLTNNGSITGTTGVLTGTTYIFTSGSVSAILGGTAGLVRSNVGTVTLSGANTYTGATVILTNGTLALSGAGSIGNSSSLSITNGIFDISGISGTGTSILALNAGTSVSTSEVVLGSKNLTVGDNVSSNSFYGKISGTGTVTKVGTSVWSLAGSNTYSGGFTLSNGLVRVVNSGGLDGGGMISNSPFGTGTLTFAGGTLRSSGTAAGSGGRTIYNSVNLINDFTLGDSADDGALTFTTNAAGATTTLQANVTLTALSGVNWNQPIGGNYALTKAGAGALSLGGSNANLGIFTNSAGAAAWTAANPANVALVWNGNGSLGYGSSSYPAAPWLGTNTITLADGSVFGQAGNMNANTTDQRTLVNNLVLAGNVAFGLGSYANYLGGNIDLQGASRTITLSNTTSVGGVISNGALTIASTSASRTFSLTNSAATYTGATTVNGGGLVLTNGGSLSASTALNLAATTTNASFDISGITADGTEIGSLAGQTAPASGSTASVVLGSKNLTSGGDNTSTIFAGVVSGASGSLTKVGAGTLILRGINTYGGATTIGGGSIQVTNLANAGISSGIGTNASITITNGGTLDYAGTTNTSTDRTVNLGAGSGAFGVSNAAAALTLSGVISNAGSLTKSGAGTLVLAASNTYTGGTLISAGVLQVGAGASTGSLGSGNITNNAGLVIDRTGSVAVADVISGTGSLTKAGAGTLALSAANTYSGGTTINAGAVAISNGSAFGSNAVSFASNGATVAALASVQVTNDYTLTGNGTMDAGAFVLTNSGVISGGGSLTKAGAGTVVLAASNAYTGGTLISAGVLQVGAGAGTGALGSGNITNNAGLVFNRTGSATVGDVISGTGSLTNLGTGTLTLGGTNTYSGATTIASGALRVTNGSALGTSAAGTTVANGASLELQGGITIASEVLTLSTTNTVPTVAALRNISGDNIYSGGITFTGTNRIDSDSGTLTLSSFTQNLSSTRSFYVGGSGSTIFTGALTNTAGSLSKDGSGTLTLSNTYTIGSGSLNVADGTLRLGTATAVTNTSASSQLNVTGANSVVDMSSYNITVGVVRLTNGTISGTTGVLGASNSFTVESGTISAILGGSGVLTKNLTNTVVTLSGANTYTGGTTINGGTLAISNGSAFGINTVTFSSSTGIVAALASLRVTNDYSLSSSGTMDSGAFVLTNSGVISGSGNLTKLGTGTLVLSGINTYSGNTTISAGTLAINGTNTGSGTVTVSGAGTVLKLAQTNALANSALAGVSASASTGTVDLTVGGNHSIASYGTSGNSAGYMNFTNSSGSSAVLTFTAATNYVTVGNNGSRVVANNSTNLTLIFGGAVDISSTTDGSVTFSGSGNTLVSGGILNNSNGVRSLVKNGTGTLTLAGASAYNGGTTISAGTLEVGDGGTAGALGTNNVTNNAALRFNRSDAFTVANNISGSGSLTKSGAGSLAMSGANTFTGATTISAGTLELASTTGSALGSTASVGVATNATLLISRADQVTNSATVSLTGGTIRTASGVSETFGNLSITGSGILDFGTTSYANANTIGFGAYSYTPSALLTINNFNYGSTMTFGQNLSGIDLSTFSFNNGGIASTSWDGSTFTITAIPEPSTYLAAAGLLGLMIWPSRRRIVRDARKILGLTPPMRDRLARKGT